MPVCPNRLGLAVPKQSEIRALRLTFTRQMPIFRQFSGTWIAPAGCDAGHVAIPGQQKGAKYGQV